MRTRGDAFTTVTSQGGLLPSDFLERITGRDGIDGLTPDDYHLAAGETVREAVGRSWNRLVGAWETFRRTIAALPDAQTGTTETRERWLLILFSELGYGRLQTTKAIDAAAASYPVSHLWGSTPIHLVSFRTDLDRRTPGAAGAARWAPHAMVQELLNRSEDHLWGFVSNGRILRLLRDNVSLTRQAFLEFDLESMMDGEAYADFVALWLLCHQSRVEAERPELCWLERWVEQARHEGTRGLERLRDGVERALTALGTGFLSHPANGALRESFRSAGLGKQDFSRELMRMVYRLLFLFVAEDRELLLLPDGKPEPRERYERYYSTVRLRRLAIRHVGTKHADLWVSLRLVMDRLGAHGCDELALPALGSRLWATEGTAHLNACELENRYLLEAVRSLAFFTGDKVRRAVDFRNLGAEELGSVYESLLELHPQVDVAARRFSLTAAPGHERKVTGSYYTPTSLITELMNSALDPLLDEAERAEDPEAALLALRVCDPACGSGHFLIAAAHRIARRLAAVRTGDAEPSPDAQRGALRDVIGRCIYGIDLNDMAVELCKVSLWLEALEPGKPLSFLDHRIAWGNSLLGTTPKLLAAGIPDDAFKPLTGDEKEVVSVLRKRNKEERGGQPTLDLGPGVGDLVEPLAAELRAIDAIDDTSIDAVREKEERWRKLVEGAEAAHAKLVADAWCAAFVAPKHKEAPAITQDTLTRLGDGPERVDAGTRAEIARVADEYRFLHWHLAFPDVFRLDGAGEPHPVTGWRGGFDLVCGNPPWEQIQLTEKEFFATRAPEIANAPGAGRKRKIDALRVDDPALFAEYHAALREIDGARHFLGSSDRYPLCGRGRINLFAVFIEAMHHGIADKGFASAVLPLGIATDYTTSEFFRDLVERRSLAALYGFENEERVFPAVHHALTFCLITLTGAQRTVVAADLCFFLRQTTWLAEDRRHFTLTTDEFTLLNPNTATCPVFRSGRDAEITKKTYRRAGVLIDDSKGEAGNPWGISFRQGLFNMTSDSGLFRTRNQLEAAGFVLDGNAFVKGEERYLPLYEAKMVHHYDHRFGTYEGQTQAQANQGKLPELTDEQHADPSFVPLPRYWVAEPEVNARLADRWDRDWLLGWRDITNNTNERTVIVSVIPRTAVGNKYPLMLAGRSADLFLVAACLSSIALDYAARQKLGGTTLNFFIFKQLPVLPPDTFEGPCPWEPARTIADWIRRRVLELTFTSHDLDTFARDLGYEGPPFTWDPKRRAELRAELDAGFFHLYNLDRNEVAYILETFPIVRRKDESAHGSYVTKDRILAAYDAMLKAAGSSELSLSGLARNRAEAAPGHD